MQTNKIILDKKQKDILSLYKNIASSIKPNTLLNKIKNLFINSTVPFGIYMYGSVGIGKTMLMKMFYNEISTTKEIIHFQKFMQDLHIKLHKLQKKSANRVVQDLAVHIASRSKVICMDEFEIKDITDAMIIMRLFYHLKQHNIFIFLTTNTAPDNLYLDGLQRESFLPFIEMIKRDFKIIYLDTEKDYRYSKLSNIKKRLFYPADSQTHMEMQMIKQQLCNKQELSEINLENFGRKIIFKSTHQNILFTNFAELFERDLGYTDYVAICEHFKIIVLESVRPIEENELNIVTRFINFIDNAYFYKILLFVQLKESPEQIYKKGKKIDEFARTVSRLNEMNSSEYLSKD